jgi:hypothetical protein
VAAAAAVVVAVVAAAAAAAAVVAAAVVVAAAAHHQRQPRSCPALQCTFGMVTLATKITRSAVSLCAMCVI